MKSAARSFRIATRGSALALAQANAVLAQCRAAFPRMGFELSIIKTTGDKLQTASLAREGESLPKGLFTKELEIALLKHRADLAVHSLKDLPTELPPGLKLGAVGKRADVRDVFVYRSTGSSKHRGLKPKSGIGDLPQGAVVGTGSTRRKAQLLLLRPDLKIIDLRGNVPTRLQKLAKSAELDAAVLAAAGLARLGYRVTSKGALTGEGLPAGLLATILEPEEMLPCVGQGAVGIEIRAEDGKAALICAKLNDSNTLQCVTAERSFLAAMGGGCQSPVAAYAEITRGKIRLRAASFGEAQPRRAEAKKSIRQAVELGRELAAQLLA